MHAPDFGVLFVLGLAVFGGILGAWLFQRLRIPQVVGYIAIGLLIGESGLRIVTVADVATMHSLSLFALGIIGFLVGGELQAESFRKYGRQFTAIFLGEGLAAFALVGVSVGLLVHAIAHNVEAALAAGIVFGAIASATDPASTIDVLWEYRSRGVLTTALIAIVALDDALAMTLYGLGTSLAQILTHGASSLSHAAIGIVVELAGAVALGLVAGVLLNFILRRSHQRERSLAIAIGGILLVIGFAAASNMDVILATMTLGVTLVNLAPRRSKELFDIVRSFSTPIYVLFFVLVGARLGIASMPVWIWALSAVYVLARSVGKMAGAYYGARISGAAETVRKYSGLGLFAQGGVAVGLSIMASQRLGGVMVTGTMPLGDMVVFGVTATTLIVQIIGPPAVKMAIRLGGEIGRNITADDVIASWRVRDVMSKDLAPVAGTAPLREVFQLFSQHDYLVYPVVAADGRMAGIISLENLKHALMDQNVWEWVVAHDVMTPPIDKVTASTPLESAMDLMNQLHLEQIPVVDDETGQQPLGLLDMRTARILVEEEVIRRQVPGSEPEATQA
jgi:Kef-type K+ transport system membrane component KefB/CBS domain-containing protein